MFRSKTRRCRHIKAAVAVLVVMALFLPMPARADESNPLADTTSPRLLQPNVRFNTEYEEVTIPLLFSHNVADASLRENNTKAISVKTEDGENIPAEIGFSDQFSERTIIYVTMRNLYPSTRYCIYIAPFLKAYNGSSANAEYKSYFTTKPEEESKEGYDQGYDQGETDSGHDFGGENQGEETADKTTEETTDPGEEITEDNMVIITDNGSETTDPEEEENEEEEENKEEEDKPEQQKKSDDGQMGGVIEEPGGNPAGGNSSDIFGDGNGSTETFGNEEAAGVQETVAASGQETSQETETQTMEPEPEPEQEKTQESQTEPERQRTERDSRLLEGQRTERDSRLPERILAGLLAAALLLAAVADRMRKRKAAEYERKEA